MKAIIFPGQGAQYKGMGKDLFKVYKKETQEASQILGFDIEELCVSDPDRKLGSTQFTQPALYTVNAFAYFERQNKLVPDYLAGHSLGEYNALLAAGAFDFATGLKLVKRRAELMAVASGGGMAAVLGLTPDAVQKKLDGGAFFDIDVANYNTPTQTVISGPKEAISRVIKEFENQNIRVVSLNVSAPFHSRYMEKAAAEFAGFLQEFNFSSLKIQVIANITARPYVEKDIIQFLSKQISGSVQWTDTIRVLMGYGVTVFEEIGSNILTKMTAEIQRDCGPITVNKGSDLAMRLGSRAFKDDYGVSYAYVAGSMYRGIASKELVVKMAKARMLSFFGTGGLSLTEIEESLQYLQHNLMQQEPFGVNLLHNFYEPENEMKLVSVYLKYGVRNIEASAFMQITEALVYFRLKGIKEDVEGTPRCTHKIMAKVSRPEIAELFMSPAPEKIVKKLVERGLVTAEQAMHAQRFPMADDICVEGDSGGHTDRGVALVLLPSIQKLHHQLTRKYNYREAIRVGLAGGIGSPQAIACAFIMGADFVVTGSINQCTVAARISDAVKDLLQDIDVQDTDYAPAGDMFEIGAKIQVLKKGVLFPARANKLYQLYSQYNSLAEIPEKMRLQLERDYFKKSISEIYDDLKLYYAEKGKESEIARAESNEKHKMALVFRWYFRYTNKLSFEGRQDKRADFQVHTGPALGAFNQWVKGTPLENWRNRHAEEIGVKLMDEASILLSEKSTTIFS